MYMHVDYVTVLAAAAAKFLLGWAWYSGPLGSTWHSEVKRLKRTSKIDSTLAMSVKALTALITSYVLYVIMHYFGVVDPMSGITTGAFIWLGTAMSPQLDDVLFEGQSQTLFYIHAGYYLASYIIMGAIIGYMG